MTVGVAEGTVRPSLAELVALRRYAMRRPPPKRGRHGLIGPAPAMLRGRGMEYAESREYVIGDDARHIDWRLTARSGKPHTKLFQAERERLSLIVADTSPLLYFGTRTRYKSVQAARAGAVAAWLSLRQGDRVGALRGSHREPPIAPTGGTRGVMRVLDALTRWYAAPPEDDTGLAVALDHAARLLRPGARLTVLADPRSAAEIPLPTWSGLALHHELTLLLFVDPLELSPPEQALPFQVDGRRVEVDMSSKATRDRWQAAFVQPMEWLLDNLPARRIQVRVMTTEESCDAWLAPGTGGSVR